MDAAQLGGLVLLFMGFVFAFVSEGAWEIGAGMAVAGVLLFFAEGWRRARLGHR
jgi:hypothetical protein